MKHILILSVFALLLFSCKKQDVSSPYDTATTAPTQPTYTIADYMKLTIGNYWIYQIVSIDTLGNVTPTGTDSCYVEKDTMMNGYTYAKLINYPFYGTKLMRDSASFLLDQDDDILFTTQYFNTELYKDSLPDITIIYSIPDAPVSITVPMGTYTCYDYMGVTTNYTPGYKWGHTRYSGEYYSAGTGVVEVNAFYISQPGTMQGRLVRAHVN